MADFNKSISISLSPEAVEKYIPEELGGEFIITDRQEAARAITAHLLLHEECPHTGKTIAQRMVEEAIQSILELSDFSETWFRFEE